MAFETILVIDDNAIVLRLTEAMLIRRGYDVIACSSGHQAIEFLETRTGLRILVALIDTVMKGLAGPDTAKELLRLRPGLPIIWMTGFPEHADFLAGEGQIVINKPFTSVTLVERIHGALKAARPGDSTSAAGGA